jgi:hypothetical protein
VSAALFLAAGITGFIGSFAYAEIADGITDNARIFAGVEGKKGLLRFGCDKDSQKNVVVQIETADEYLGNWGILNGWRNVTYRFDKKTPVTTVWFHQKDAIYINGRSDVAEFLGQLKRSGTLYVRLADFRGNTVDREFTFEGGAKAVDRVVQQCGDSKLAARMDKNQ